MRLLNNFVSINFDPMVRLTKTCKHGSNAFGDFVLKLHTFLGSVLILTVAFFNNQKTYLKSGPVKRLDFLSLIN